MLRTTQEPREDAEELMEKLPNSMQRSLNLAADKGASTWLSTLPIEEHGFALHKSAFRVALCLRYGWQPALLPSHCVCGKKLSIDHAFNCTHGGFLSVRHNEIRFNAFIWLLFCTVYVITSYVKFKTHLIVEVNTVDSHDSLAPRWRRQGRRPLMDLFSGYSDNVSAWQSVKLCVGCLADGACVDHWPRLQHDGGYR